MVNVYQNVDVIEFLAFLPCGPRAELYFRLCLLYICADRSFSRMMRLTRL